MTKKTLLMDVKVGQSLILDGGRIIITLEEKSGQRSKLRFVHDGVQIERAANGVPPEKERRNSGGAAQAKLGIKIAA